MSESSHQIDKLLKQISENKELLAHVMIDTFIKTVTEFSQNLDQKCANELAIEYSYINPENHPDTHPDNHSVNHSVNHPDNHSVNHPDNHPDNHSDNHPVNHHVNHPVNHPDNHSENHPDNHHDNHHDNHLDNHSDNHLNKHSVNHPGKHLVNHSDSDHDDSSDSDYDDHSDKHSDKYKSIKLKENSVNESNNSEIKSKYQFSAHHNRSSRESKKKYDHDKSFERENSTKKSSSESRKRYHRNRSVERENLTKKSSSESRKIYHPDRSVEREKSPKKSRCDDSKKRLECVSSLGKENFTKKSCPIVIKSSDHTRICRHLATHGYCSYEGPNGEQCKFLHPVEMYYKTYMKPPQPQPQTVCKFWEKGPCLYGNACYFRHSY